MSTPVFVIVRDRFEQLKRTVASLEPAEDISIVLVDNASTYEPTIEYLKASPHQVVWTGINGGHHSPWTSNSVPVHSPFAVTDPDIEMPDDIPNDWPAKMLAVLTRHQELIKVGPSLRIDDLPDHYVMKHNVIAHENQFWHDNILEYWGDGTPVYAAALDTTLAFYPNAMVGAGIFPAARVGGIYTARHLAWYVNSSALTEDEIYYRTHADRGVSSWPYAEGL